VSIEVNESAKIFPNNEDDPSQRSGDRLHLANQAHLKAHLPKNRTGRTDAAKTTRVGESTCNWQIAGAD
jgi:hypothetical protein